MLTGWLEGPDSPTVAVLGGILLLLLLLYLGTFLQARIPGIKKYHVPGALVGGVVGLLLGPQIIGAGLASIPGAPDWAQYGLLPPWLIEIWEDLPEPLTNMVFAGLLLGKTLPPLSRMLDQAGPQIVMGHILAWGQYVVAILITLFILIPFFEANPLSSALIAIGFQGGYGTAIGLVEAYNALGFPEGRDLAVGMATIGKVMGLIIAPIMIKYAMQGQTKAYRMVSDDEEATKALLTFRNMRRQNTLVTNILGLQIAKISIAIGIGWLIYRFLLIIEQNITEPVFGTVIIAYLPLFPFAMIGGLLLQLYLQRKKKTRILDRRIIENITGAALDLVIISALATLHLDVVIANFGVLALLAIGSVLLIAVVFYFMAPRLYVRDPWIFGVSDLAHSSGAVTTGLMVNRAADPQDRSGAKTGFNLKQPLYEPLLGGGIITALAMPMMYNFGLVPILQFTSAMLVFWVVLGLVTYGPGKKSSLDPHEKFKRVGE